MGNFLPAISAKEEKRRDMICCLCGEPIELGQVFIHIQQYKRGWSPRLQEEVYAPLPLEDGTNSKTVHPLCPAEFGVPLTLIGADGSRSDV
jgi:hypothetical protein